MSVAISIKNKRERLGLTQKELSDALGMPKFGDRTLRRWENGESSPSNIELQAILNFPENPPFKNSSNPKFTMIDLFAGIGGIRLAFQKQGGAAVFSSEWDKFAQKTYKANFGDIPAGDITLVEPKSIPDHDILLGGFPCQPFSQAGLKKGFEDTRGTLFFNIAQIIETKRPRAFLLENVKQLRGHDKGKTLQTILKVLDELDYEVFVDVLKATDFGVPQKRERIFLVGFRRERNIFKEPFLNKNGEELKVHFEFPQPLGLSTRVGDILEKNIDEKYTISDKLYAGHLRRKQEHKEKGNGFGFSLFNEDSPYTNTISARYYKDGSEVLIDQGNQKNPRKLTPRECARLQGFPEDFIIPVSDSQAYKQFGNSVSVPVIEAISKNMINSLNQYTNEINKCLSL